MTGIFLANTILSAAIMLAAVSRLFYVVYKDQKWTDFDVMIAIAVWFFGGAWLFVLLMPLWAFK